MSHSIVVIVLLMHGELEEIMVLLLPPLPWRRQHCQRCRRSALGLSTRLERLGWVAMMIMMQRCDGAT